MLLRTAHHRLTNPHRLGDVALLSLVILASTDCVNKVS
jgi:hypothetical protein